MELLLKILRKIYTLSNRNVGKIKPQLDVEEASHRIYELLTGDKPVMIARYGAVELSVVYNYLGILSGEHPFRYIKGEQGQWWWNPRLMKQMENNAGFYPATPEKLSRFSKMMIEDSRELDLLGSWMPLESILQTNYINAKTTHLRFLEPFWSSEPWTKALKDKKVLIVHPFAKTIRHQYDNRVKLFNKEILPEFLSLTIIPAVQSIGQGDARFKNWFEALDWMKSEIDKSDYDVCLIGCGAYGFPLAAHVKRQGKKAIHLGGALQLLFGIIGARWENPEYGVKKWNIPKGQYSSLINEYWVRPDESERPETADNVEGACYW